jgi:hypothetical protein
MAFDFLKALDINQPKSWSFVMEVEFEGGGD